MVLCSLNHRTNGKGEWTGWFHSIIYSRHLVSAPDCSLKGEREGGGVKKEGGGSWDSRDLSTTGSSWRFGTFSLFTLEWISSCVYNHHELLCKIYSSMKNHLYRIQERLMLGDKFWWREKWRSRYRVRTVHNCAQRDRNVQESKSLALIFQTQSLAPCFQKKRLRFEEKVFCIDEIVIYSIQMPWGHSSSLPSHSSLILPHDRSLCVSSLSPWTRMSWERGI